MTEHNFPVVLLERGVTEYQTPFRFLLYRAFYYGTIKEIPMIVKCFGYALETAKTSLSQENFLKFTRYYDQKCPYKIINETGCYYLTDIWEKFLYDVNTCFHNHGVSCGCGEKGGDVHYKNYEEQLE